VSILILFLAREIHGGGFSLTSRTENRRNWAKHRREIHQTAPSWISRQQNGIKQPQKKKKTGENSRLPRFL
jgi:hypothetical protein